MKLKEFDILLDIKRNRKTEEFEVVQNDYESNILNIAIVEDFEPYNLTGLSVEIAFAKGDGTTVLQDEQNGVTIINAIEGKITCTLKTNTIAAAGKVSAEVRILQENKLLTTTRFNFFVRRAIVNNETIESTNEFPILNKLITDVGDVVEAVPVIEEKMNEITNTESGLNQSIQEGDTLKTGLDNSITEGNLTKTELDSSIVEGNAIKGELDDIIVGTDFEQVITELNNKANKTDVNNLAGEGRTIETVKQNADDILAIQEETKFLNNLPVYNMLPDSGRFSNISPSINVVNNFNNMFFKPYNNSTPWAEVGKFIYDNSTFGGTREALNQTTIDLLSAINKLEPNSPAERRYGIEFYIVASTMGNGTSLSFQGKYLLSTTKDINLPGASGLCSMAFFIRATNGNLIVNKTSNGGRLYENGELAPSNIEITPEDGWTHIIAVNYTAIGYDNSIPYIYTNEGVEVQIALPVLYPGEIAPFIHTAPVPTMLPPVLEAPSWITAVLQNGWAHGTGGLQYFKDSMGIVNLHGEVKDGTTTSGTIITTLPEGYRPTKIISIPVIRANSTSVTPMNLNTDGTLKVFGNIEAGTFRVYTTFRAGY